MRGPISTKLANPVLPRKSVQDWVGEHNKAVGPFFEVRICGKKKARNRRKKSAQDRVRKTLGRAYSKLLKLGPEIVRIGGHMINPGPGSVS